MKLHVVCSGSVSIGMGHLFRARSFARAIAPLAEVQVTAIVDASLEPLFADIDVPVRCIAFESELAEMDVEADVTVLDTTTLDVPIVEHLKDASGLIASLSPVFDNMEMVDCVFLRHTAAQPLGPATYTGLEYAVFSEYCRPIPSDVFGVAARKSYLPVAICMGGSDASNKTLRVLEALVNGGTPLTLWVLLGEGYGHQYDELVRTVRDRPQHEVILAKTNRSMWQILENCALAVLSGGLTTVEAVYAGLPSINLFERKIHADLMAESFYERGVCVNAGVMSSHALTRMQAAVDELAGDRLKLLAMHQQSRGLLDNQGAHRVYEVLRDELAGRLRTDHNSAASLPTHHSSE